MSLLFIPSMLYAACTGTSPNLYAASASRDDVMACVNVATYGDTINIPECAAGGCVWAEGILITKDVKIKGQGTDAATGTNITVNLSGTGPLGSADQAIFWFAPDSTSVANLDEMTDTHTFEISGISFTGNNTSYKYAIQIYHHTTPAIRRVKIYDNKFTSLNRAVGGPHGAIHGVFYNNVLYDTNMHYAEGASYVSFDSDRSLPGSGKGWYVEDNTIIGTGIKEFWLGGANNEGGAVVYRYNTASGTQTGVCDYIDIHGNQIGINAGQFTEIYGNKIELTLSSGACNRITYARGGQIREFFNIFKGTGGSIQVIEEYSDVYSNNNYLNNRCSDPVGEVQICNDSCICQKVHNSYFFNNRRSATGSIINVDKSSDYDHLTNGILNAPVEVVENREYFKDNASFNGASGIGCGPLANLPATCTAGVGYWATNQSCSNLTGMVGANPSNPIMGTLYKCTSTDTWKPYYTPYTYPHLLRVQKFTGNIMIGGAGLYD